MPGLTQKTDFSIVFCNEFLLLLLLPVLYFALSYTIAVPFFFLSVSFLFYIEGLATGRFFWPASNTSFLTMLQDDADPEGLAPEVEAAPHGFHLAGERARLIPDHQAEIVPGRRFTTLPPRSPFPPTPKL